MPTDPRLARPPWRGRTNVDALTIAAVERAESIGGHAFTVTQGSYQSVVAASAGTHDGGGAVDLRWCGHEKCIRALRVAGMAAWHRAPADGPWVDHIHAVVVDHPKLSPSAAHQVSEYRAGRNGLRDRRRDEGPRVTPIAGPIFPWPPPPPAPSRGKRIDPIVVALKAARRANRGKPRRSKRIQAALNALRQIKRR